MQIQTQTGNQNQSAKFDQKNSNHFENFDQIFQYIWVNLQDVYKEQGNTYNLEEKQYCRQLLDNSTINFGLGAMFGAFMGDALGSFLQFNKNIEQHTVDQAMKMPGKGTFQFLLPGQFTDDSQMAAHMLKGLLQYDPKTNLKQQQHKIILQISKQYNNWYKSKPFDIGITTRIALSQISQFWIQFQNQNSCGSSFIYQKLKQKFQIIKKKNQKTQKRMKKYIGFMMIMSMSGMAYFKYFQYNKTNQKIQQLYKQGKLQKYLFDFNQQSAFSIDTVMDSYQMGYNQFTINNYRSTLAKQCTGKILQTCAGSNRNLKFYKPSSNLTLIDWSPNMVSIGMTKTLPTTQYKYVVGDVTKMPFNDDQFDCVIDTFGLQYVINPTKALQQMRRVCKKNGKIILMNQGLSSFVQLHYWQKVKWGYNLLKGGYFSNRNWQKLIQQFDFQIIHKERKRTGKIYIFILQNKKNQAMNAQIHDRSERAQLI